MFFGLNDVAFLAAVSAPALDPDAAVYIAAVEAADTQALEPAVRAAINDFVVGCKADGIWAAIKASCILAGARTLTGALVPLVGAAPTNFNFVAGDYNRKTGLVGNGSTKYLDSNRNNNADPQNSKHLSVYATTPSSLNGDRGYIGTPSFNSAWSIITMTGEGGVFCSLNSAGASFNLSNTAGLLGVSRSENPSYTCRTNKTNTVVSRSSSTPFNENIQLYRRTGGLVNARLAFYSIGESLDLALLDARVTALINAFDAAI
jgi:hypothetical protein